MRASHASSSYMDGAPEISINKPVKKERWKNGLMVKGRNEPVTIVHVAYVVAKIKNLPLGDVVKA
jgi:TatD DNase family protein